MQPPLSSGPFDDPVLVDSLLDYADINIFERIEQRKSSELSTKELEQVYLLVIVVHVVVRYTLIDITVGELKVI